MLTVAGVVALAGCNSEKVSWSITSDTGSGSVSGGGAIIRIRYSGNGAQIDGPGRERVLTMTGRDERGPLTARLLVGGEVALLESPDGIRVRSRALGAERALGIATVQLRADAAALEIAGFAADRLDPAAVGAGRLWVAAEGTLLVLQHGAGVVTWRPDRELPRYFGPEWTVVVDADTLRVVDAGGRFERLVPAPPPAPEERVREVGDAVELLGPGGRRIARIPREAVTIQGGRDGRFLTASFPDGLDGVHRGPFALTVPASSRYVLRIDF